VSRLAVIDYGLGNLESLQGALSRLGHASLVTEAPEEIGAAPGIILPGVGAAGAAMRALRSRGLDRVLRQEAGRGKPLLGICLGMQVLFSHSEEGDTPCLGLIPGRVRRFSPGKKVPQIGWNRVEPAAAHPLLDGVAPGSYFYFLNSYYCVPEDPACVTGVSEYGETFCSVLAHGPLCAVQFHPERSGTDGLRLLDNFVKMVFSP